MTIRNVLLSTLTLISLLSLSATAQSSNTSQKTTEAATVVRQQTLQERKGQAPDQSLVTDREPASATVSERPRGESRTSPEQPRTEAKPALEVKGF